MADKKIVSEWLKRADEDFLFAKKSLELENNFFAQICFHFHQSVEKYLKAYIVANNLEFKKIHDLVELLRICSNNDNSFSILREDCEYLNPFYIDTRYPVFWKVNYTEEIANKTKECAERIRKFVQDKLER